MRYIIILIVAGTLFTACQKKNVAEAPTTNTVQRVPRPAPGATKDEVLAYLAKTKASIVTNTPDMILAEEMDLAVGISNLGNPNQKLFTNEMLIRWEIHFKDGKLITLVTNNSVQWGNSFPSNIIW